MVIGPTWTEWLNCLSLRVGMGRTLEWGRVLRCRPGSVLGHYTRFLCERPLPVRAAPSGVAASRFVVRWGSVPFLLVCGTSPISGLSAPVPETQRRRRPSGWTARGPVFGCQFYPNALSLMFRTIIPLLARIWVMSVFIRLSSGYIPIMGRGGGKLQEIRNLLLHIAPILIINIPSLISVSGRIVFL